MPFINSPQKDYIYNIKKKGGGTYHTNMILIGKSISMMKAGYSPIILFVGAQRSGKSFGALWMAHKIFKFFHPGEEFKVKEHTFYDPINAIRNLEHMSREPLLIDEAGSYLSAHEWYSKLNLTLSKIIQTQGYTTLLYILISPFGQDIAKTHRKHINYIVNLRRRGVLTIKEVTKKYDDLSNKPPKAFIIEQIKIKKNALPRNIWNEYEKFSFEKKEELRKELAYKKEFMKKDYFGRYEIPNSEQASQKI